jgi:hypothetical protein
VLTKYSSQELTESRKKLREFRDQYGDQFELIEKLKKSGDYKFTISDTLFIEAVEKMDFARGRLSAFFWEVKTYCKAGYLDKEMIAAALDRSGHEMYLTIIEPMDWIHTNWILRRNDYDDSIRLYFEWSLKKYF